MRPPFSPVRFLLSLLMLVLLFVLVQLGLLNITADKLGLSLSTVLFALFISLSGSLINIPLFRIRSLSPNRFPDIPGWFSSSKQYREGYILVAVNLGGAVLPMLFSVFLFIHHQLIFWQVLMVTIVVTAVSYSLSIPIPKMGIAMPVLIPPLIAALMALMIAPTQSAAIAYVGGTFGVILGADILKLKSLQNLGAPFVSIGGAGTFDGIFLTGIIAVLLT